MMARSTRSNQRPDTLMQDRICQIGENLLQRTAGPYIGVRSLATDISTCRPERLLPSPSTQIVSPADRDYEVAYEVRKTGRSKSAVKARRVEALGRKKRSALALPDPV
jgi:acyl-CoA thioesterase